MSLSARTAGLSALLVGCAVVIAIGCSDSSSKKVRGAGGGTSEGGEAGEPGGGAGGSVTKPIGGAGGSAGSGVIGEAGQGQGGTTVVGQAGAATAGAPSEAGAPEGGEPGAAGAGPLACVSSGLVDSAAIPEQEIQTVCRGALIDATLSAPSTASSFTCCGAFDATSSFTVTGIGEDTGALISFVVPSDAPGGNQSVSLVCSAGPVSGSLGVNVVDTLPPVVTGVANSLIYSGDNLEIDGSNLSGVSNVTAVATGNPNITADCLIDPDSSTDSALICSFDGDISVGDYYLVVEEDNCGMAVNAPTITVQQSL
jgi:hypothetical protein